MRTIARHQYLLFFIPYLIFISPSAMAKSIKGVDIPQQITLPESGQTLVLNGAGIRSKFFFSIYIGALYLTEKQQSVPAILQNNAPRRVVMHCLYHEIDKDKLTEAWNEGFDENTDKQSLKKLQARLKEFNKLFPALHEGDIVILDYYPGKGTTLRFNGKVLGNIPGQDFNIALLKVWLGQHPADSDLKSAMLGSQ